jgi:uncharacterized membrane protein
VNLFTITILRILHIVAASFWVGGALMNAGFLLPAIRSAGPAGGQVMRYIAQRRLPLWMNAAMLLTLASGIALYGWRSAGFTSAWMMSRSGIVFGIGGILGILTGVLGILFVMPAGKRLGALGASLPAGGPPPEAVLQQMGALQARMAKLARIAAGMVVLAATCMAIARYL